MEGFSAPQHSEQVVFDTQLSVNSVFVLLQITNNLVTMPDPGQELPMIGNKKSSSWEEIGTKSPH